MTQEKYLTHRVKP